MDRIGVIRHCGQQPIPSAKQGRPAINYSIMLEPLEEDQVLAAAAGDTASLKRVLAVCYPPLCRIAIARSASLSVGLKIVRQVIKESVPASEDWQDARAPFRWTLHRAIFLLRDKKSVRTIDPLVQYADRGDVAYIAAVKSLRGLPPQQLEAFLLSLCEKLDDRMTATAMDCSTTAAGTHLAAADQQFARVTATDHAALLEAVRQAYAALSPDPISVDMYVKAHVRDVFRKRQARRAFRWLIRLAIFAAILAGLAWLKHMLI